MVRSPSSKPFESRPARLSRVLPDVIGLLLTFAAAIFALLAVMLVLLKR